MLLITVDSGNLLACAEYEQVTRLAELTVTSRADIYTMDVADNDICFYPSSAGTTASGTPMNALLAEGHDPYGIFTEILKEAGIAVVPNFRVNDHHGSPGPVDGMGAGTQGMVVGTGYGHLEVLQEGGATPAGERSVT